MSVRLLSAMRVVEESMPNQPPVFKDGRPIPLEPAPWPVGVPQPVVPPGTPPDVQVVWEAPEPLLAEEADAGVDVDVAWDGDAPTHPLVTVADSLTQGFKSLAITDTHLSWPAIVAWELGLSAQQFTFPRYPGPAGCPGLPLNLEAVARGVDRATGGTGVVGEHPVRERRCCVSDIGECEDWADGGWPWLEAGGEFVEGGANPIMQGQLGGKLVVAASQVLYEGVPG
jgi:hypothetical protein